MCGVYFQSFSIFIQSFFKIGSKKEVKTMKICSRKRLFSKQVHIKTISVKKLPNVFLNLENSSETGFLILRILLTKLLRGHSSLRSGC